VQDRLWRKTRISRQNVPESFWNAAVELLGLEGIHPVAAVLGLNYYRLKTTSGGRPKCGR